jgi:hypothetical protein
MPPRKSNASVSSTAAAPGVEDTSFDSQATVSAEKDAPASAEKKSSTRDSLSVEVCEPPNTPSTVKELAYTWDDVIASGDVSLVEKHEPWETFVLNAAIHNKSSELGRATTWDYRGKLRSIKSFGSKLMGTRCILGKEFL